MDVSPKSPLEPSPSANAPASRRAPVGVAVLAVLVAAAVAGRAADRLPAGLELDGPARARGAALSLAPGTTVTLGEGREVAARGEGPLELGLGPVTAPVAVARVVDGRVHLVDAAGAAIASAAGQSLPANAAPWVRCSAPLTAGAGDHALEVGPPPPHGACERTHPAWVRALGPVVLHEAAVDARPVELAAPGVRVDLVVVAGAIGAALALLLGPGALWPLLGAPVALLSPVAPLAVLPLFAGAAGVARGGRRGWIVAFASALGAAALTVRAGAAAPSDLVARALLPTVSLALFERKVEEAANANREALARAGRPLVVALGGSSSGGGTRGRFWPQVLQERLGERATVVSLAWGGATTWHLRRVLDRLDVRADLCVLYGGHNDTTRSVPGRTIAQVEAGAPAGEGLVAPVSLEEARANVLAMKDRCDRLVVIQERVRGRDAEMAAYAEMLRGTPGVTWLDGERLVSPSDLLDDVHLHPRGHEAFADHLHTAIAGMIP